MFTNRQNRRGYVLVMTLGLLALAAISLASLARYSLSQAVSSREAADEVQRRWALLSAQHVLMERADEILDAQVPADQRSTPPWPKPATHSTSFTLGELVIKIRVADEEAKLNLNTVHARKPDRLRTAVRQVSADSGLRLQPQPQKTARAAFASWGQVFELTSLPAERDAPAILLSASEQLTLWGKGRLNLRRASDAAVRSIAGLVLSAKDVGELVGERKHWGGENLDALVAPLGLRRGQLAAVRRLLATDSRSYSLWVELHNGQRSWFFQFVEDGGTVCFAW